MKKLIRVKFTVVITIALLSSSSFSKTKENSNYNWKYLPAISKNSTVVLQQVGLAGNNISSFFFNTGAFNQDRRTTNTPGFEWPIGTGKNACFTAGLSIGTVIDGILKEASCLYNGEYAPGYINNSSGTPIPATTNNFKIYKVSAGDNAGNNPDYAMWYKMVPYGAPYTDINNNGIYDDGIDKPGIKNASSTIFECLTDGYPENHFAAEGFGGGTPPIFCEIHFTAWAYNFGGMEDVQFLKWEIINKNVLPWDSTFIGIPADPDLGYANDDYIGCDTLLNLGYCYNADNDDSGNQFSYGINPPAFGMDMLRGPVNKSVIPQVDLKFTSFDYFIKPGGGPSCEYRPDPNVIGAYNFLKGTKADATPWVNPVNSKVSKYCYSGDPESNSGWTEFQGHVENCGGSLTGTIIPVSFPGGRFFVIGAGANNFRMLPNDTQTVVVAQMMARGTNNLNSVTKLKQLSAAVQNFYNNGLGVNNVNSQIPISFSLYQNYPNPFNPITKIKFDMVRSGFATLKIYDSSGKEVSILINNEMVSAGTNEVSFDAKELASGIYFYTLTAGNFTDTKRMVLIK